MSHRETNFPQIAQVLVLEHWRQWRFIRPHPNLVFIPFLIWRYLKHKGQQKSTNLLGALRKKDGINVIQLGVVRTLTLQEIRCRCFFRELPSVSTDAFIFPPFFRDLDLAANLDLKGVDGLMIDKWLEISDGFRFQNMAKNGKNLSE